ncbi:MAG: TIGR02391 family protein [Candidatus Heimdallarchaeaceae archaeon]
MVISYLKRGLLDSISNDLGINRRTLQRRIQQKKESLANLYSPTVCAFAYAHEQGLDYTSMMDEEELRQVKEILGSGLKLVISDRSSDLARTLEKSTRNETESLRALLTQSKEKNRDKLAIELYDQLIDHPRIREVSRPLWASKNYRSAVLDAQIELENLVKVKSKYPKDNRNHELSGTALMFKVFDVNNPLLKWSDLSTQVLKDELEGYKYLFVGAVMGIRNPKAHRVFKQTPWRALQLLVFTNLLAELVDRCIYCGPE